jgi:hypothetical protein
MTQIEASDIDSLLYLYVSTYTDENVSEKGYNGINVVDFEVHSTKLSNDAGLYLDGG